MPNRKLLHRMLAMGAMFALASCGNEPPPPPAAVPQATVLDAHLDAMDKARAVEGTLEAGKDRTDAALEAAEAR